MKTVVGLCAGAVLALSAFLIGSASGASPADFSTTLPLVVIDSPLTIRDEPKVEARMRLVHHGGRRLNHASDAGNEYEGPIGIEIRGASSQLFPKKSYTFETRKKSGKDKAVALLGLPKESDWVLYASYNDKTLMRNVLAYWTARRLGHYAPRTRHVELVLNGRYQGVYVLIEKPKIDANRVHVRDDDVTGGYLLEATSNQKLKRGDAYFRTPVTKRPIVFYDPPRRSLSARRAEWISDYVREFEVALYGSQFADPDLGYAAYLDVGAAVDYVLVHELFKNQDAFISSSFLHKDIAGKLVLGPVWDFDISMGNSNLDKSRTPAGWMLAKRVWSSRLYRDPAFVDFLIKRWTHLRTQGLLESLLDQVDETAAYLGTAQSRNFTRWPILGKYVWPNPRVRRTYEAELAFLRSWLEQRVAWIDANVEGLRP